MSTCKRRTSIANLPIAAGGTVAVAVPSGAAEYSVQVVDAAGAGLAFSIAYGSASAAWHLAAGESWTEERLALDGPLTLTIGCDSAGTVEVVLWEG